MAYQVLQGRTPSSPGQCRSCTWCNGLGSALFMVRVPLLLSTSCLCAGYLPGMMLPHIKFFGAMSLLYIALGVAWAGLYARYWTEVFTLQHCISAVLALGMMEMSTWCAYTLTLRE